MARSLLVLLIAGLGFSRTLDAARLTGVTETDILIERLDDDAKRCGVTEDALDAAVRLQLSASRVPIKQNSAHTIYVAVNALLDSGGCVASIRITGERTLWRVDDSGNRVEPVFLAAVWGKETLMTGRSVDFGRRVSQWVEDDTKQWIAQWLKDNPK